MPSRSRSNSDQLQTPAWNRTHAYFVMRHLHDGKFVSKQYSFVADETATICEITIQTARNEEITQFQRLGSEEDVVMLVNRYVSFLHEKRNSYSEV